MARRILILSLAYLPRTVGGAEIAIKEITDRIDSSDIEFHMITNRYDSTLPRVEQIGNVLVHRIGLTRNTPSMADLKKFPLHLNKFIFQVLAVYHALKLHRRYNYDGVWAMMAHATGLAVALLNILKPRLPYLLTLQEGDPSEHIERMMKPVWPLFTRCFTHATVVQSISKFLDEWAIARGAQRHIVIPNGVGLSRFVHTVEPESRYRIRQQLGLSNASICLLTISRLVVKNGVDILIKSLTKLPPEVKLVVLGDGPLYEELVTLAEVCGVSSRVHFLGQKSQEEIVHYLAASDVFARASRSEGQGIAFIEAMAMGVPTVGTSVGGIPEFLIEGKTGYVSGPDNPEAMAEAILRACNDPHRDRVIEEARSVVRTRYDWDAIARRMRSEAFGSLLRG